MSKVNDQMLERLFQEAERQGACVRTTEPALQKALKRRVTGGTVVSPVPTLYARATTWQGLKPDQRALYCIRALQQAHPSWVFCRESAALVRGLPISYHRATPIHIAVRGYTGSSRGGGIARHALGNESVEVVDGIQVTSLTDTLVDCLRTSSFIEGLAIADRALAIAKLPATRMQRQLKRAAAGRTGLRRAVGIMGYADARSESWAESAARAQSITQGFVTPDLQVEFERPLEPGRTYRVDLVFRRADGTQVLCEVDGAQKYENKAMLRGRTAVRALADEQHREAQLTLYGKPIMRLSPREILDTATFVRKLEQYGIPRSASISQEIRRLASVMPSASLRFAVVPITPELIERMREKSRGIEQPSD